MSRSKNLENYRESRKITFRRADMTSQKNDVTFLVLKVRKLTELEQIMIHSKLHCLDLELAEINV